MPLGKCNSLSVCVLILMGLFSGGVAEIIIHGLYGTENAQLDSNNTVLTCDFEYNNVTGVEVKWFFDDYTQIYISIPGFLKPHAMGPFSDVMEVDEYSIHFKELTRNMTGKYTCKITTDSDEAVVAKQMNVFDPPVLTEFFLEKESETVICSVYEVFPMPKINITGAYMNKVNELLPIEKRSTTTLDTDDGCFNVTEKLVLDLDLAIDSILFECIIDYPETNFSEARSYVFRVEGLETRLLAENSSSTEVPLIVIIADDANVNAANITLRSGDDRASADTTTKDTHPGGASDLRLRSAIELLVLLIILHGIASASLQR